jgi:hypothetical protein
MLRQLIIPALVALILPAAAGAACPDDAAQQIYSLTEGARAGDREIAALSEAAKAFVADCGEDRVVLSLLFAMFAVPGLEIEPPNPDRFQAQLIAFRTGNRILRAGAGDFAQLQLTGPDGAPASWSVQDERNIYWDLMFAMSGDYLVFGAHGDLYTPGKIEQIGCGLYPDEEASALAQQASGNLDGGELVARVSYLGRACDTAEHEASGYAARYFGEHARARADDPGNLGLTEGDIRAGLNGFLDRHLDGAAESWLFDAGEVLRLRGF